MDYFDVNYCFCCNVVLSEPYIKCVDCQNTTLSCLSCFSKGKEMGKHLNNHAYTITRYNFPVLDSNWTASEEMELLHAVSELGLGNWAEIARQVKTKSQNECKTHYIDTYINKPQGPFPALPEVLVKQYIQPLPIVYKAGEDPPRPSQHSESAKDLLIAGYMPARGDFTVDYDNYAELDICNIEFSSDEENLAIELKFAILDAYRLRLKERKRRHNIIREHGLINIYKQYSAWHQYENTLKRCTLKSLAPFAQLFSSALKYETYIEGLHVEKELMKKIALLQECRKNGIIKLHNIMLYNRLKKSRIENKPKRTFLDGVLYQMNNNNSLSKDLTMVPGSTSRRQSAPLNIVGLSNYEKLSEKERKLCSVARLVPDAYLEFKSILVNEFQKNGSLRLAQARTLIKIDVNKTRKIFDYLIAEGIVHK